MASVMEEIFEPRINKIVLIKGLAHEVGKDM